MLGLVSGLRLVLVVAVPVTQYLTLREARKSVALKTLVSAAD